MDWAIASVAALIFYFAVVAHGSREFSLGPIPISEPVSGHLIRGFGSGLLQVVDGSEDLPIAVIEISEATFDGWGRPGVTPREKIQQMLASIMEAGPRAVVLDLDLSFGATGRGEYDAATAALAEYIEHYPGPQPILLVASIAQSELNSEVPSQVRRLPTPYDRAVAANPYVEWVQTLFLKDGSGTAISWSEWWDVCAGGGFESIAAVQTRLLSLHGRAAPLRRPARPDSCNFDNQTAPRHRLLNRPYTQETRAVYARQSLKIQDAGLLLEPDYEVRAQDYFSLADRVVIVGATHSAANDTWRTDAGAVPGVFLVAESIRLAALQMATDGPKNAAFKLLCVVMFLAFALLAFVLRPVPAYLVSTLLLLVIASIALTEFRYLAIFDCAGMAVSMFVVSELARLCVNACRAYSKRVREGDGLVSAVFLTERVPPAYRKLILILLLAGSLLVVVLAVAAVLVEAGQAQASPADARPVGVVWEFLPKAAEIPIRGDRGSLRARLGMEVFAGDVVLLGVGQKISINLSNGRMVSEEYGDFQIPDAEPVGSSIALASIKQFLNLAEKGETAFSAVSRGSDECAAGEPGTPIVVPILQDGAHVVAGSQHLSLAWFGGCPPFHLKLERGAQPVAPRAEGVMERRHQFRDLDLMPGLYTLTVADRADRVAMYPIRVLIDRVKAVPDLEGDHSPLGVLGLAIWLGTQQQGAWKLESFKLLRPLLAEGSEPAAKLADYFLYKETNSQQE